MNVYDPYFIGLVSVRILGVALFLYVYYKSRRKSALSFALVWLSAIPTATFGLFNFRIENLFVSLSSALLVYGFFSMLMEETDIPLPKGLVIIPPLFLVVFGIGESILERNFPEDGYILGGFLAMMVGGIAIDALPPYYGKDGKRLGFVFLISGFSSVIYPLFYQVIPEIPHYVLIFAQIFGIAITLSLFYFYYKIILSPRFIKKYDAETVGPPELKGVYILSPEKFKQIKTQLETYPVLAFLRNLKPSEKWNFLFFTTLDNINMPNAVHPTDLYKIADMVNRYIFEMKRSNLRGIVVIEGLEYLRIYNGFPSIAKMLSAVRDYVVSNNGALIVVADKNAWDEREWNTLRRVLGIEE